MQNLRKERKVVVEKVNHYSIHLEHDSTYHTCKTEEDALTLKKQLEKEEKKLVAECNDQELRNIEANKIIRSKLTEVMQELVTTQRETSSEDVKRTAKGIRGKLKGLIEFATNQADEKVGYHGKDIL